ncbi:MAG: plasmid mobilization relaxosome protein MobC [Ruminococcaceae bacterium]|nr:plasmid mobilization relaxosome protein MobC [Oscillospiraceae bacterium]
MKHNIKKNFWFNEKEAATLKMKAEMCCLTEAGLIRMLVMGFKPKEAPPREFYTRVNEINMIGVNLKQLVAKANTLGFTDVDRLKEVINRIDELAFELKRQYVQPERDDEFWQ